MDIKELKKELESHDMEYRGVCHDCGNKVVINARVNEEGVITIEGGVVYKIKMNPEDKYFFKCDKCFKLDTILRNWQNCEVYSRIVGYLRPISQWNKGKKAEYAMREEFKNTD